MNLEDVIDPEYGLQQDEWSLSRPRFGEDSQLEVVGWSGHFKSVKSSLLIEQTPCGCSKRVLWTKEKQLALKIINLLNETKNLEEKEQ